MRDLRVFRNIFFLLLIFVLSVDALVEAQNSNYFNGYIKDSLSNENLPYANVILLERKDSSIIVATITDENGRFELTGFKAKEYICKASFMGYEEKSFLIDLTKGKLKFNILLTPIAYNLSEVSVEGERNETERSIEKFTFNVAKNTNASGGSASDVLKNIPGVDYDFDGNLTYRGSDKVMVLIDGELSELSKMTDQLSADQIEKVEVINNPSAKYDSDGTSGIINIVLKSPDQNNELTTLNMHVGHPGQYGATLGNTMVRNKAAFYINPGFATKTRFQTKEHFRDNYANADASNYYQYDRQDKGFKNIFINSGLDYAIADNQKIKLDIFSAANFDNADRSILYNTLSKNDSVVYSSDKDIYIKQNNFTLDGKLSHIYKFSKKNGLRSNLHYSVFTQMKEMNNEFFPDVIDEQFYSQNTFSGQYNKIGDLEFDYYHLLNDSIKIESGLKLSSRDLENDFRSESMTPQTYWVSDTALNNLFNYNQLIGAAYVDFSATFRLFKVHAGIRVEYAMLDVNSNKNQYFDLFPTITISEKLNNNITLFVSANRRINRPTIKMLNPYSDEYADILNLHRGNPDLEPEYVNSVEVGGRFVYNKFSGISSFYFRDVNQAISRVKAASNDSALFVSFINLNNAKFYGGELSLTYKAFDWWSMSASANVFYTSLSGVYNNNQVDNFRTGYLINYSSRFNLFETFGLQLAANYRSKLPSVMGVYMEKYYMDIAIDKSLMDNNAKLIFRVSDLFNTYKYGFDLDAIDDNGYSYSQINRRKNESRFFILSFIYNISGKQQESKKRNDNFYLESFDK